MNSKANVGSSIKLFRLAKGMGQIELARLSQISAPTISMIETGNIGIDDKALRSISKVLDCSVERLQNSGEELDSSRPWLRAYADAPKKTVSEYVANSQIAVKATQMTGLRLIEDSIPLFGDDLDDFDAIEDHAAIVREAAGLSEHQVIPNVIRATERLGCFVLPMESELGKHLGLSIRVANKPVIRVSRTGNNAVPGDRQRFTVAHELGHLALHYDLASPSTSIEAARIEKQAHRFAAAFLIPSEALVNDIDNLGGRVTLTTLVRLKEKWGFSVKAFVSRIREIGLIDSNHARSLYKQISARKWNREEPVTVLGENAVWLKQVVGISEKKSSNSLDRVAANAGIGLSYFHEWLRWEARNTEGDVIEFVPR